MNLQYLVSLKKELEDLFGETWLKNSVKGIQTQGYKKRHPIVRSYYYLDTLIEKVEIEMRTLRYTTDLLEALPIIAYLSQASASIRLSAGLNFFNEGIPLGKIKDSEEFSRYEYIARIAAILSTKGYKVEFVATLPEVKTPDLKINFDDGSNYFIECKKKDRYIRKIDIKDSLLSEQLYKFIDKYANRNITIEVFILNNINSKEHYNLIEKLEDLIKSDFRGILLVEENNCYVVIKESILQKDMDEPGVFIPLARGGHILASVGPSENGKFETLRITQVIIYGLDVPKLNSIFNSFNTASQQIFPHGNGYIAIEIDVGDMDYISLQMYINLMSLIISKLLNRSEYSHIQGVLLTTSPYLFGDVSNKTLAMRSTTKTIFNQNSLNAESLNFPGEVVFSPIITNVNI